MAGTDSSESGSSSLFSYIALNLGISFSGLIDIGYFWLEGPKLKDCSSRSVASVVYLYSFDSF
jgi:hypothetical protein